MSRMALLESKEIQKRVSKACDRCRIKKNKCDISTPCRRCSTDNAICVFSERKKSYGKSYPSGYVEMLERQQAQLAEGLQEMYKQLKKANVWSGSSLCEKSGHPLTHDILVSLNLLGQNRDESFEPDVCPSQKKTLPPAFGYAHHGRPSTCSDSEQNQQGNDRKASLHASIEPAPLKDTFHLTSELRPPALVPKRQRSSSPRSSQPSFAQTLCFQYQGPQLYQLEHQYSDMKRKPNLLSASPEFQQQEIRPDLFDEDQVDQMDGPIGSNFGINLDLIAQCPVPFNDPTVDMDFDYHSEMLAYDRDLSTMQHM